MWTYLTTPFAFAMDVVATEELEPWRENGEIWRRLKVTFPQSIATHPRSRYLRPQAERDVALFLPFECNKQQQTPVTVGIRRRSEVVGVYES
jgi:hypothetical protein